MTEEEWLTCDAPIAALDWFRTGLSERKLRLFACACWEVRAPQISADPAILEACERASQCADSLLPEALLPEGLLGDRNAWYAAMSTLRVMVRPELQFPPGLPMQLLRDVFGNPFRPVTFNPAWRTTDVALLATGIYDERAFDRMPILADALQDAECDNNDLLKHLRDSKATHVRGCWALDLVLGKE